VITTPGFASVPIVPTFWAMIVIVIALWTIALWTIALWTIALWTMIAFIATIGFTLSALSLTGTITRTFAITGATIAVSYAGTCVS
jgi:hypothetical protein